MNLISCPACGTETGTVACAMGRRTIYACPGCGVQFLSPQLSPAELEAMYQESYYKSWGLEGEGARPPRARS